MLALSPEKREELKGLLKEAASCIRQLAGEEKQAAAPSDEEHRPVINLDKLRSLKNGHGR